MGRISLRLPESLHKRARKLAEQENISINQLITLALAEKISALMTEDYLNDRAKFEAAMAKVADIEPEEEDSIQSRSNISDFRLNLMNISLVAKDGGNALVNGNPSAQECSDPGNHH